jgi:hypothetical protein
MAEVAGVHNRPGGSWETRLSSQLTPSPFLSAKSSKDEPASTSLTAVGGYLALVTRLVGDIAGGRVQGDSHAPPSRPSMMSRLLLSVIYV